MEEVLNNLINIDSECKKILNELEEKQDNIEYFVNEELDKRKDEISSKYKFKTNIKKNEYEVKLSERIAQLELEKEQQIEDIRRKYNDEKIDIINSFYKSIVEGR